MSDQLVTWFVEHGAVGVLALGLAFGLRTLWNANRELQARYDKAQDDRIAERDQIVKALVENTSLLSEVVDLVAVRRR
jgi:hypothetical protein